MQTKHIISIILATIILLAGGYIARALFLEVELKSSSAGQEAKSQVPKSEESSPQEALPEQNEIPKQEANEEAAQTIQTEKTPPPTNPTTSNNTPPAQTTMFSKIFHEDFSRQGWIEESGRVSQSKDNDWSVSSGAFLFFDEGLGTTVMGEFKDEYWKEYYNKANPVDSDNGLHPQNIFRLVQRGQWKNYEQSVYFRIKKDNFSDSPYRNGSNGLLLFNRYQDANNLYYVGIRVDGTATIKKKKGGTYYDLDHQPLAFLGDIGEYEREENMSYLPKNTWLGLKSIVRNEEHGQVSIKVYIDVGRTGNWTLVAKGVDDGKKYGGAALSSAGMGGIRTDFMDVQFDDYTIKEYQ